MLGGNRNSRKQFWRKLKLCSGQRAVHILAARAGAAATAAAGAGAVAVAELDLELVLVLVK